MCGRFVSNFSADAWQELQKYFSLSPSVTPAACYNVAPTQNITGIVKARPLAGATVELADLTFGMAAGSRLVINARAETLTERPMFRHLLSQQRTLILTTGFYEWAPPSHGRKTKQPIFYSWPEARVCCFAALRQKSTQNPAGAVIITTEANADVAPSHARMPVILGLEQGQQWLSEATSVEEALALLQPFGGVLEQWPVGNQVNNPRHNSRDCIERVTDGPNKQLSIF